MRIGILALGFISRTGGGQTVLREFVTGLCTELSDCDSCVVFVSRGQEVVFGDLGTRTQIVTLPSGVSPIIAEIVSQTLIPFYVTRMRIDVLFCPNNRCPVLTPVPVVLMVQVNMFHFTERDSIKKKIADTITRLSIRVASHILVASENHRDDLLKRAGVEPNKVHVVHLAADGEKMKELARVNVGASSAGSGVHRPYVLFVSVIRPYKNLETAIKAFEMLVCDYGHDVDLMVAGDYAEGDSSDYRSMIESLVSNSRVTDRVRFLGNRSFQDVCRLYSEAKVFIFPSRYEGFGLPVLEAMAAGVPVVSANSWSLPEIAGNAALLVPPDDVRGFAKAMDSILQDLSLQADLREKGRRNVERFSWKRSVRKLHEILTLSVSKHPWPTESDRSNISGGGQ